MPCAAPTVVLVLRLLMNSTAGYDVTLISMSVIGFSLSVVCELFLKKISCFMYYKDGEERKVAKGKS